MERSQEQQGLIFQDVCVDIKDKRILWNVSGHTPSGAVLAVMGPSGSGKTTLLNALSGHTPIRSGHMTMCNEKLNKTMRRRVSYVLQEDIFFPNLTLKETITYSALLRLPREVSFKEKLKKVEDMIDTLRLRDCVNTYVGNSLVRGLSGGERKRTNLACELLTDPTMLLLDEPTSGLDSSSALSLMVTLVTLARHGNKIIVASIHQPSSQLYHMFNNLLLLAKGKVAYFGPGASVLDYFSARGLRCTIHYNPADFIVEMVSQQDSRRALIGEDPPTNSLHASRKWWQRLLWRRGQSASSQSSELRVYEDSPVFPRKYSGVGDDLLPDVSVERNVGESILAKGGVATGKGVASGGGVAARSRGSLGSEMEEVKIEDIHTSMKVAGNEVRVHRKWPTAWYWQFGVLTVRTFRHSRHIILSKLNILQTFLMAILAALLWFQMPLDEANIGDREGYLFFSIIYTNFFAFFTATFSLPAEHVVVSKERRSGSYHLSAYYLAKSVSELPLVVALPLIYFTISYWVAAINSFASYFALVMVITVSNLVGQGFGLLVGALFMNLQQSLVATTVILLGMLLLGGFYVQHFPSWLFWARYASYISYAYDATLYWGFWNLEFSCSGGMVMSVYEACQEVVNGTGGSGGGMMVNRSGLITSDQVLDHLGAIRIPWYWDFLIVVVFGILLRLGAYLCLRFLHRNR